MKDNSKNKQGNNIGCGTIIVLLIVISVALMFLKMFRWFFLCLGIGILLYLKISKTDQKENDNEKIVASQICKVCGAPIHISDITSDVIKCEYCGAVTSVDSDTFNFLKSKGKDSVDKRKALLIVAVLSIIFSIIGFVLAVNGYGEDSTYNENESAVDMTEDYTANKTPEGQAGDETTLIKEEEKKDEKVDKKTSSSNNEKFDKLQNCFISINEDSTKDDILKLINDADLEYTEGKYNGGIVTFKIAYTKGAAQQKYADAGDCVSVSFDNEDKLQYVEYSNQLNLKIALYYNHGTYWDFRDGMAKDYSGYYVYEPGKNTGGIIINYNNGYSQSTGYYPADDAITAINMIKNIE